MTTYAVLHGAWASAAHARPLEDELIRRGHDVVSPDLPIDDPAARFSDYAAAMDAALGNAEDVVALAKSMGGCSAAFLAQRRPVRSIVFVAALIPQPGRTLAELLRSEPMVLLRPDEAIGRDAEGRQFWTNPDAAHRHLWQDADQATSRRAFAALRPQALAPYFEPFGELPDVDRSYIVCRDDRTVSAEWGREAAPRLLGVDALEIDGGHCPGLVRPAELADLIGA